MLTIHKVKWLLIGFIMASIFGDWLRLRVGHMDLIGTTSGSLALAQKSELDTQRCLATLQLWQTQMDTEVSKSRLASIGRLQGMQLFRDAASGNPEAKAYIEDLGWAVDSQSIRRYKREADHIKDIAEALARKTDADDKLDGKGGEK